MSALRQQVLHSVQTQYGDYKRKTARLYTHLVLADGWGQTAEDEMADEQARGMAGTWWAQCIVTREENRRTGSKSVLSWHTSMRLAASQASVVEKRGFVGVVVVDAVTGKRVG